MSPFDLNIRHLAAHATIAATGSLSDAARRIHLSQPAVTQGVAKLERQLDTSLFVRQPTGMEPTEAGRVLALRAEAMLRFIGPRLVTSSQIRAFLALASAGAYAAASAESGLSEASLHRAVADLSATLGTPLAERRGRSLVLTRRGRDLQRRFTLAIREIESALVELAALAGREIGRIAVGAMPLSRSRLLPKAIAEFLAQRPTVSLSVVEGSHAELVGPLRDGHIEMMVGALRDNEGPDLVCKPLFKDAPIIVARAGHPLHSGGLPPPEMLAAYPWIISGPGTPLRALWERMFETLGLAPPDVRIECGSAITIRQLLVHSDHLALLSADQVSIELDIGLLAKIGTAPGQLDRTIGVTTRLDWRPTPAQADLIEIMSAVGARIGGI